MNTAPTASPPTSTLELHQMGVAELGAALSARQTSATEVARHLQIGRAHV